MEVAPIELSDAERAQAYLKARQNGIVPHGAVFNGGSAEERVSVVRLADVQPESVEWLWKGYVPAGKLTVLEGDPGLGKSTLTLAIAAAVSRGRALPGGELADPADVVLVTYEDGLADTLRPRLDAAGADVSRIHAITGIRPTEIRDERPVCFPTDVGDVFEAVMNRGGRLIVIDPLAAALTSETDSYKDADVRRALAPMARLAEESGAALIVVRHLTKSAGRAIATGGGSIGIAAAARSVLAVHHNPEKPDESGARVLAVVKCNLTTRPASLAFTLASAPNGAPEVQWAGESHHTADGLSALRGDVQSGAEQREIDEWLRSVLSDGPQNRKEILKLGRAAGFSDRSLDRAGNRLDVRREKSGFGKDKRSEWSLPAIAPNRAHHRLLYEDAGIGANGANGDYGQPISPDLFESISASAAKVGSARRAFPIQPPSASEEESNECL